MPWTRLDDQFAQHPKMLAVGPLGLAMQTAALCYCNQYLTDGFVSRAAAARLQRFDNIDVLDDTEYEHATRMSWELVVDSLVDAGVWEPVDGGWRIHDYPEYQPTREQVLAEREASRQRQLKLRKSRRDNRVTTTVSHAVTSGEVQGPRTRTSKEVRVRRRSSENDDDVPPNKKQKEQAHHDLLTQAGQIAETWNGKDSLAFDEALEDLEQALQSQLSVAERDELWAQAFKK